MAKPALPKENPKQGCSTKNQQTETKSAENHAGSKIKKILSKQLQRHYSTPIAILKTSPKGDQPSRRRARQKNRISSLHRNYNSKSACRFHKEAKSSTGGKCLSVEYTDKVGELAQKHGLKLHIDGARIFNASVALGIPVHRLVQAADSVSVCLSKGLGAPVGSVIVGSKSFIAKAKILRKTLGGGMRQVGILCAAALVAVQENVEKLEGDHKNAKILAEGLNQMKGIRIDVASVETNIIFFEVGESSKITAQKLCKYLEEHGILVMQESLSKVRIVVHHQISESDVQYTLSCFQQALTGVQDQNGI